MLTSILVKDDTAVDASTSMEMKLVAINYAIKIY